MGSETAPPASQFPRARHTILLYGTRHTILLYGIPYSKIVCLALGNWLAGWDSNTKCHFRDAGSIRFFTVYGVTRAAVHVNIKGKDLKQLLVTYTCDAEQMSMSSLLKFLIPSANSSRTVERRENVRLGCELRVD